MPASAYRRSLDLATGIATASFERGGVQFTETVFISAADKVLVVHLLAGKPGSLNFRAAVSGPTPGLPEIRDRRELVAPGVHAWVLPFESDVRSDRGGVAVEGEGEALVIVAFGQGHLAGRFSAIGEKYAQRAVFPDLIKVWEGLLSAQTASAR